MRNRDDAGQAVAAPPFLTKLSVDCGDMRIFRVIATPPVPNTTTPMAGSSLPFDWIITDVPDGVTAEELEDLDPTVLNGGPGWTVKAKEVPRHKSWTEISSPH